MIDSAEYRTTLAKVMALGFLLATLVVTLLSVAIPAGAAAPSGKAFRTHLT
jgi:uncharacterized membrane protein YccF (DUF307 family)